MRLVFLRHGQSVNNASRGSQAPSTPRPDRVPDPPLTDLGQHQAECFAGYLTNDPLANQITHIYISRMIRTAQTAAPIAAALNHPVHIHPDLHEAWGLKHRTPGDTPDTPATGVSARTLQAHCPHVVLPAEKDPDEQWDGGMETTAQIRPRAEALFDDLTNRHTTDDVVLLVTHRQLVKYIAAYALGVSTPNSLNLQLHNTGLVELHHYDDRWRIEYYNRTEHLTSDQISE